MTCAGAAPRPPGNERTDGMPWDFYRSPIVEPTRRRRAGKPDRGDRAKVKAGRKAARRSR